MNLAADSAPHTPGPSLSARITGPLSSLFSLLYRLIMGSLGLIFDPLQKLIGTKAMPYLFVIPNLVLFIIFALIPIFMNFVYAVTGGTALLPANRPYIGLQNFNALLTCGNFLDPNSCVADLFWRGVMNTIVYVIVEVGLLLVLAMITALILNRQIIARGFFRSIFFYPTLLSSVVVALLWKWVLQRNGILNGALDSLGIPTINFLFESDWARLATIIVGLWASLGFYTLILLAGLQAIPALLYEAAVIDGASRRQQFQYITLPLMRPTLYIVFLLAFVGAVQVFEHAFVLTDGGPGTATFYIMHYVFNTAFAGGGPGGRNFGLATAATLLVAVVLVAVTLLQRWVSRNASDDYST
ncbi:MAG: sugar ABC transporter permease [Chloroflexi bacterium]|nr:sugar ABC transporter permease [Chloroflexota bacterium]